jgi:hypothetical protein
MGGRRAADRAFAIDIDVSGLPPAILACLAEIAAGPRCPRHSDGDKLLLENGE